MYKIHTSLYNTSILALGIGNGCGSCAVSQTLPCTLESIIYDTSRFETYKRPIGAICLSKFLKQDVFCTFLKSNVLNVLTTMKKFNCHAYSAPDNPIFTQYLVWSCGFCPPCQRFKIIAAFTEIFPIGATV